MSDASATLEPALTAAILRATGATRISAFSRVQTLWSGYGEILRVALEGAGCPQSVVVKRVRWPSEATHPRGWATSRSHERKVRSYEVEANFYRHHATKSDAHLRVPTLIAEQPLDDGVFLILEDLDSAGFTGRRTTLSDSEVDACLRWLAHFHATHLNASPDGLWPTGTYWHLQTRPDELAKIAGTPLHAAAATLDAKLRDTPFQTLVHGDAKVANFCFGPRSVAAVDFQYVGGGCGIKDVAYFIGSCFDEDACQLRQEELLDRYCSHLHTAVARRHPAVDGDALCQQWRELYPVAWTDFYRFLAGWSPDHWKVHAYTKRLSAQVLGAL